MPNSTSHHHHSASAIRVYLGGSFDPVHLAHIQMAMRVYDALTPIATEQNRELKVSLLPNARSPFKQKSTDPKHRLAMLKLAVKDTPLQVDELELWQAPPVYTIDSVRTLRKRYPNDNLIFMMGMDSARSLAKWQNGLQLTDYVHLWVFNRNNLSLLPPLPLTTNANTSRLDGKADEQNKQSAADLPSQLPTQLPIQLQPLVTDCPAKLTMSCSQPCSPAISDTDNPEPLKNAPQGRIYIDERLVISVSSTQIRQQLRQALSDDPYNQQDDYQHKHQYNSQRNHLLTTAEQAISAQATPEQAINEQISNGNDLPESLAKWLNPAVYHYIIAHQLYSAA
ncbi:nicotinate-nicotinamide nucleotide adenylyltransferase [Psychrobacter sp.]|uniref:nicotinate-nicotinamide nucleotide adenylyltransferase n=1 Tax=Psychrobacter sp. TaxID=56811 RepID=UPI00264A28D1|nr:nicotinate-nicotinamide nucleotide adenylyltransferase [Psychrobacter sp.]MDN6275769.1 nicotinate-nicotinamide nucleotide adenylyltransferase [Psychrobacter sp.]MDN6307545.1 nicotinate-nicotinamide nucleotide adenylyltransferase [Psychrobacter sp.]